jgi:signal transduction histidine kinase
MTSVTLCRDPQRLAGWMSQNRDMQKSPNRRGSPAILLSICCALLAACNPSSDLDQEIAAVDAQLDSLPAIQPNMLCPTIGFGSEIVQEPDHTTWLDIILPETRKIDTIVLIPALLKNKAGELETLGFPLRFTIEAWRDETPGTQHAYINPGGWIYQAVGSYDPTKHPNELVCELELNQSIGDGSRASAPVSVSLYYANEFEPTDGLDIHTATEATQVGQTHIHQSWTEWSVKTGKPSPVLVNCRFNLSTVPAGATLFLQIANDSPKGYGAIDNVSLNSPFALTNGDFESPQIKPTTSQPEIAGWYNENHAWAVIHQGAYWAGEAYSSEQTVIDHSKTDFNNPGTAPVVFTLPAGTMAKEVRIKATRLQPEMSWRENNKGHNLALNEVLLFDGLKNVALNSRTASADHTNYPLMFYPSYAVDGYSYFPPINPKEVSSPDHEFIDEVKGESQLQFDLGRVCTLDEIRLYPVDRSPQFSHIYAMGVGFPRNITLRIGNQPDPKAAQVVLNINTAHQIGSAPLMRDLKQTSGRYVWLEMSEGQQDPRTGREALGLSEIELLQNGTNVLAGVQPLLPAEEPDKLQHLTNGLTSSGIIMPHKEWLLKLHRRAMLEQEKGDLLLQQQGWAEKQQRLMQYLKATLLTVLIAALLITLLIRNRHRRNLRKLREKIGASLHDEVGANLSSIALSSEMLTHTEQLSSPQARQLNDDITRVAQETATEIRLLSRFLEKQGVESNLIGQFRRVERQMLAGMQTRSDFGAPEQFNALTPTEKWELVLFLKEALHNIVKHAHATRVEIRTQAGPKQLHLEITDNGQGLQDSSLPPVHLTKRAKKLHAHLSFDAPKNGGTIIRLTIPKKRRHKK